MFTIKVIRHFTNRTETYYEDSEFGSREAANAVIVERMENPYELLPHEVKRPTYRVVSTAVLKSDIIRFSPKSGGYHEIENPNQIKIDL